MLWRLYLKLMALVCLSILAFTIYQDICVENGVIKFPLFAIRLYGLLAVSWGLYHLKLWSIRLAFAISVSAMIYYAILFQDFVVRFGMVQHLLLLAALVLVSTTIFAPKSALIEPEFETEQSESDAINPFEPPANV